MRERPILEKITKTRLLYTFTAELKDILPVPTVKVSADAIADFKRTHKAERERFKLELDRELLIGLAKDHANQREYFSQMSQRISKQTTDLERDMRKERWKPAKEAMWVVLPTAVALAITREIGLPTAIGVVSALFRAMSGYINAGREAVNPYAYAVAAKHLR